MPRLTRLQPRRAADVRPGTPERRRGGRSHIRGDAPESPAPRRPPVRPVRPVSPVRDSPPNPRRAARGRGRGARGRGCLLKGPGPLPSGHFLGAERTSAASATPGEGGGGRVPRLPAVFIRALGHSQPAEHTSSPLGGYKAAPPSVPVSSASIFCDPRRQPGLASEWPQSPGWTRPRRQRSARGLRSQPFRVGPVLATVTCWLDSGNPLSEDHRGESLTTPNRIRPDFKLPSPLWLPSAFFIPSLNLSGISVL
nr:uncharacterized protein LOC105720739 [Aotus nancymaae]